MSVVRLSVCPLTQLENYIAKLYFFLCILPVTMAQSSSFVDVVMFSHNGPVVHHVYS